MSTARQFDPLYVIFERYLFDFPNENLDEFIEAVVTEYLAYLHKQEVAIPEMRKFQLMKDLADEVYEIYIKKVHGCLNIKDYRNSGRVTKLEKLIAQDRYFKMTG